MKKIYMKVFLIVVLFLPLLDTLATEQPNQNSFNTTLSGFQEVPAISTTGTGEFRAQLDEAGTALTYELEYSGLEGTATVAHVHFGQRGVNGGISFFLCGGGNKPPCPAQGTVTGTVTAADVVGPAEQGISPGDGAEIIAAMRNGVTYANVHTDEHPNGEIRGQISGPSTSSE
ncbi:CHRD domain-containing protein [Methylobacter sp. sgz302048]|uniref:CHRD domain-containing protein n=1 Tax=Methylobacter sp. sgz302048 TaxID=3455945 RepID=UPI003FA05527